MATPAGRHVTRADVARYAGVSTAVVSYVVNDGPRPVAADTAARVRDAMRVLQYQPNFAARALKRGSNQTLGLIVIDGLNPFFAELSLAVERAAARRGHRMLVADSHGDPDIETQLIGDLLARQVDGLLLASSVRGHDPLSSFHGPRTPRVLLNSPIPVPGRHTIGPNAHDGARAAVQHLILSHGCDSVGLVIGPGGFGTPDPRQHGWERALHEAGLPPGPVAVHEWTSRGGYLAGRQLLSSGTMPGSMFVSSDVQAIGFLRALHEAGLTLPQDCPVASFDGTLAGGYTWPALTSARQPLETMAAKALELIEHPQTPPMHHTFEVELVIRDSCGCAIRDPDS